MDHTVRRLNRQIHILAIYDTIFCMKDLKIQARRLRERGFTYHEIQKALGAPIPKSTLSTWCSDIRLTNRQLSRIKLLSDDHLKSARQKANSARIATRQQRDQAFRESAERLVKDIDLRNAKLALAMLYLGEGYKYPAYRGLRLGSSDPAIILLYIRLLGVCYAKRPEQLKCLISYRADQDLNELINFWATLTSIPATNFYRSKPDPRTTNKPTKHVSYKGVAIISCIGTKEQLELSAIATALLGVVNKPY